MGMSLPPRASWKGFLKVAEVTTPVALYAAASSSGRIALHAVNRATGHRLNRQYVDADTGAVVPPEDQVKGYEIGKDEYVTLEPEEVAAVVPQSDKTLDVAAFIDCDEIDELYFDRPYFLAPAEKSAARSFALLCEGMRTAHVAALARTLLFRRIRSLLIRPFGAGLLAITLKFDYETRSATEAFAGIPQTKSSGEVIALAKHIIKSKQGKFDPSEFHDRYEAALAELVKAKIEGRPIPAARAPTPVASGDLLAALRESAGVAGKPKRKTSKPARRRPVRARTPARRKAS